MEVFLPRIDPREDRAAEQDLERAGEGEALVRAMSGGRRHAQLLQDHAHAATRLRLHLAGGFGNGLRPGGRDQARHQRERGEWQAGKQSHHGLVNGAVRAIWVAGCSSVACTAETVTPWRFCPDLYESAHPATGAPAGNAPTS